MKILFVNFTEIYGGGEVYLESIIAAVNKEEFCILLSPKNSEVAKEIDIKKSIGYSKSGKFLSFKNFKHSFKEIRLINKMVKAKKIDIVFFNGSEAYQLSPFIKGVKKIGIWHGNQLGKGNLKKVLNYFSFKSLNKLIVVSNHQRNKIIDQFSKVEEKISVIYNGVDEKFLNIKKEYNKDKVVQILILARLEKLKGHLDLLSACKMLKEKGIKYHLNIAGIGEEEENLKQYVLKKNLEKQVKFLGFVNPYKVLERNDIFVLPSYREAFPLSICEAMLSALPVVTTNIGGIPEAFSSTNSKLLFSPGDVETLASNLEELIISPKKRKESGLINREEAKEKFIKSTMINKTLKEIEKLNGGCCE